MDKNTATPSIIMSMNEKEKAVISDIEKQLEVPLDGLEVKYYTDGATDATVFNLGNEYLVKITDLNTVQTQREFLQQNPDGVFQDLLCSSDELCYECFKFIDGIHYNDALIDAKDAAEQIYKIVSQYREYPHDGYGFLNEEHVSWRAFLLDEIEYARRTIPEVSTDKVMSALEKAGAENPKQYLMHGDFGTHNFLLEGAKIRVIDPMPVVGDYLYDFYFALLSNTKIFTQLGEEYVYHFFPERDISYKRAVMTVALYVRTSRAAIYDKDNLQAYLDLYDAIIEK